MKRLASSVLIGIYLTLAAGSYFACGESASPMDSIMTFGILYVLVITFLVVDEKKKAAMELLPTLSGKITVLKMSSNIEKKVREFWEKEELTDKSVDHEAYRTMLAIENIVLERENYHDDWPDTSPEWDRTIEHAKKNFPQEITLEITFCKVLRKVTVRNNTGTVCY